jgi:predicted acylesterase/phospholipase RssA
MRELGLPIDRIGGTSVGAVVAALVGMELDAEEMIQVIREKWAAAHPEREYTLPLISLLGGGKGRRILDEVFGDVAVEDLWIPYFCCSTNLSRSELVVHREGRLSRHILASIAIPGVSPPVVGDHGDLLVDGGVLDNIPAAVMAELGEGPMIAVDVSLREELSLEAWGGVLPSVRQVIGNRLSPFAPRLAYPSIFHILVRSTTLGSVRQARRTKEQVDLYLEPPVAGYNLFAWDDIEQIAAAGYRYALERIRAWPGFAAFVSPSSRGPV